MMLLPDLVLSVNFLKPIVPIIALNLSRSSLINTEEIGHKIGPVVGCPIPETEPSLYVDSPESNECCKDDEGDEPFKGCEAVVRSAVRVLLRFFLSFFHL